uniref:Uncharacterized protein n=1 Tax=Coturnix japonica TaxID=93934 RepID=A0A8C2SPK1_COTJA
KNKCFLSKCSADSIRTLLDNGASVNQCDVNGRTLLANAAYSGNLDVVNLLVSRGADLEVEDNRDGWTALRSAAWGGHTEVAGILIKSKYLKQYSVSKRHVLQPAHQ